MKESASWRAPWSESPVSFFNQSATLRLVRWQVSRGTECSGATESDSFVLEFIPKDKRYVLILPSEAKDFKGIEAAWEGSGFFRFSSPALFDCFALRPPIARTEKCSDRIAEARP